MEQFLSMLDHYGFPLAALTYLGWILHRAGMFFAPLVHDLFDSAHEMQKAVHARLDDLHDAHQDDRTDRQALKEIAADAREHARRAADTAERIIKHLEEVGND